MRHLNKLIFSLLSAAFLLMGCSMSPAKTIKDGDVKKATVKKTVKIGNFSSISARQGIMVVYSQGKSTGYAHIATTPSAEKYLRVYVKGDELVAEYKSSGGNINGPTIVTVSSPRLKEVDLESAARLEVKGKLNLSDKLEVEASSAARACFNEIIAKKIELDLSSSADVSISNANADEVSVDVSSASRSEISKVTATVLKADASSAARIDVDYFNGTSVSADASSGSAIHIDGITASRAYAEATSGANVTLKGNCPEVSQNSSSGGRVNVSGLDRNGSKKKASGKHTPRRP